MTTSLKTIDETVPFLFYPNEPLTPGVGMWFNWYSIRLACCWRRFESLLWQGIFLPESTFSEDPLTVSVHPCVQSHAFTSVHMLKMPLSMSLRVWWIMETLKHPACTVGWVVPLCCSWLSTGKATRISHGRNPFGTIQLLKKNFLKKATKSHPSFQTTLCWILRVS